LGAQGIVTGSLTNLGDVYRFRVKVINVETARIETQLSYNMGNDARVTFLLQGNQQSAPAVAADPAGGAKPAAAATGAKPASASTVYKIGDTGPAGGIVFYDKGIKSDDWRYLEAAPAFLETRATWGSNDTVGTSISIGSGKQNTASIVKKFKMIAQAAQYCDELVYGGYADWFLPSNGELNLMYANLKRNELGSFSDTTYWSSSEDGSQGWDQDFTKGSQGTNYKSTSRLVRAVRQF
jgi:hypothetical protein